MLLQSFFAAEAAALGAIGSTLGFAIGVGVAIWIGRANFHAPVSVRLGVLPVVLVGGIVIALVASIVPISLVRRVQPANILRGE
jgi:putative ABC transport system permease protein